MDDKYYVYFVQAGDAIKVGIATNVDQRIVSLQVGNPHQVELIHKIATSKEKDARKLESKIHTLFRKTRLNGEWFQSNRFMIEFINQIEEIGYEAALGWADDQYQRVYGDLLDRLKTKIENYIMNGNMLSCEKLKKDLGEIVNTVFVIPSIPVNMAEAVREWVKTRQEAFFCKDVYFKFGIVTNSGKKNVVIILRRLVDQGMLERHKTLGRYIYKSTIK